MSTSGPVYEVTHRLDRDIRDEFDDWLSGHVDAMLALPGITGAEVAVADDDESGRAVRVTQYRFASETALDEYLAEHAERMRHSATERFGERFDVSRRVLRPFDAADDEAAEPPLCLNCDAPLGGQYCGQCGQRAQSRLISIWELTRDAFGDLFEFDSRLWRTLIPLCIRPGHLTRDYLEGRRARFMPPFRTYLVLSILFFVVAFFDPREEFSVLFLPEADVAAVDAPEEDNVLADEVDVADENEVADEDESSVSVSFSSGGGVRCDMEDIGRAEISPWLARWLTPERIKVMCDRIVADGGANFLDKLLENVPAGLFFLLPLMALVLKVLYPLSRRYYVEHLLFVVHLHAFVFLILTLQVLLTRVGGWLGAPDLVDDVTGFVVLVYLPVYLYKAMRRVYRQRHLATAPKFVLLILAYLLGFSFILAFAALVAALSV